jgi:hypothetical protein
VRLLAERRLLLNAQKLPLRKTLVRSNEDGEHKAKNSNTNHVIQAYQTRGILGALFSLIAEAPHSWHATNKHFGRNRRQQRSIIQVAKLANLPEHQFESALRDPIAKPGGVSHGLVSTASGRNRLWSLPTRKARLNATRGIGPKCAASISGMMFCP